MSLLKTSAVVGSLTVLSRALGFVRDLLIAFLLGTDIVAEAFFVAQRLPNLFRALFAEGAFNNAFVPQFAGRLEVDGKQSAFRFAHDVYSILSFGLIAVCAVAMLAMPLLVAALAPGFSHDPATSTMTIEFTRICFPFLVFISLVAMLTGVLNSLGRFAVPALAPIFMNLTMIGACLIAWKAGAGSSVGTARLLSYGVALSGLVQLLLLFVSVSTTGFNINPGIPRFTPEVKMTLKAAIPGILSGGISQINLAVATALASGITGGVAFLYYAERLFEFPLGVVGVTIGVVLLPALSRKLRVNDLEGIQNALNRGLELSMFLTLPAAAALVILGTNILKVVFEHGAFGPNDTLNVSPVLAAFASSLPAFTLTKVLQPLFYARHDMKTPMYFAIGSALTNIVASMILVRYYQHTGIAMATSIAAWLNAGLLLFAALRQGYCAFDAKFKARFPATLFSTAVMCGALWVSIKFSIASFLAIFPSSFYGIAELLLLIVVGAIAYITSALLSGAFAVR